MRKSGEIHYFDYLRTIVANVFKIQNQCMLRCHPTAIILHLCRCNDMFAGTFTALNNRQSRAENACLHMHSMQSRKMLTQIDWNSLDRVRRKITVALNLLSTSISVIFNIVSALHLGFVHCTKVFAPACVPIHTNQVVRIHSLTSKHTTYSILQHCNGSK